TEPTGPKNVGIDDIKDFPVVQVLPDIEDPSTIGPIVLDIPDFEGVRPDTTIDVIQGDYSYTPSEYEEVLLSDLTDEIHRMLGGELVLPEAAWRQIYTRTIENSDNASAVMLDEAANEYAARGWSTPGGVLNKRIREAQQKAQDAKASTNREIFIKRADMEVDTVKFAVAQGIAVEQLYLSVWTTIEGNKIRAVELAVQTAISFLNVQVAVLNAQVAAYQADASVYKTLIEAEVAKLEQYRIEIQLEQLELEADKIRIEAYNSDLKRVATLIEHHNSQVNTVRVRIETEKLAFDAYAIKMQGYLGRVQAYSAEWDGYAAGMRGEVAKTENYKARVQAYGAEVDAYRALIQGEGVRIDAEAKIAQMDIERMNGDIKRYLGQSEAEINRIEAQVNLYDTEIKGYGADVDYFDAQVNQYSADIQGSIANAKASQDTALANAQLYAGQMESIARLNLSASETVAKIEAQITASEFGQFSAHTSKGSSVSKSYSKNCDDG
ncbi:MAG: hypothetical protein DRI46_12495, partial [Chloroflexi bacterium]